MEQLAIHGGKPVRNQSIPYGRQYIDQEDIQAVSDVLHSSYLTTGPKVKIFEEALCELTGAKYAVAVSNGTAALHAAAYVAGIGPDDEVIVSTTTFAASANCVLYCGGTPVFADIESDTWNIDPKDIEKKITSKTKAVIAVDFTGQSVKIDEIKAICKAHNLIFIEDAAHSIGTKYNNVAIGNHADLTTFSFHPVKTITCGEGGAILTNNKAYYEKLLLFRSHGITRNSIEHKVLPYKGYNEQVALGYNYRMTDIQAALGISQLKKLTLFSARRKEIVKQYNQGFESVEGIITQCEIPESDTTRHLYIIKLNLNKLTVDRDEFYKALNAENIGLQVHYIPVYYHPYYQRLGYKKGLCPESESLYASIITLPLYYGMCDDDVCDVIKAVNKVLNYYKK